MIKCLQLKKVAALKLAGLQKLSLLDYPGKTCCTVFTFGCDFRCPFCHNGSLVLGQEDLGITEDEFFLYLKQRKNVLDGVCVTGGEPLIHSDIERFLRDIKSIGYLVKLDTNGSFPEKMMDLAKKGLIDYIAMDIKSSEKGYLKSVGLSDFEYSKIERSIDFLMEGNIPYEFRTTAVKELHSDSDFLSIAERINGAARYSLQGFVNSDDVIDKNLSAFSRSDMERIASYFYGKVKEVIVK